MCAWTPADRYMTAQPPRGDAAAEHPHRVCGGTRACMWDRGSRTVQRRQSGAAGCSYTLRFEFMWDVRSHQTQRLWIGTSGSERACLAHRRQTGRRRVWRAARGVPGRRGSSAVSRVALGARSGEAYGSQWSGLTGGGCVGAICRSAHLRVAAALVGSWSRWCRRSVRDGAR